MNTIESEIQRAKETLAKLSNFPDHWTAIVVKRTSLADNTSWFGFRFSPKKEAAIGNVFDDGYGYFSEIVAVVPKSD
jgi:hypothetical protein